MSTGDAIDKFFVVASLAWLLVMVFREAGPFTAVAFLLLFTVTQLHLDRLKYVEKQNRVLLDVRNNRR